MKTNTKTSNDFASQTFTKVLPYLFRTGAGVYYGKKRYEGKLHRRSLDTSDFEEAKRELKTFLSEIEDKTQDKPDVTFDVACQSYLDSLYQLKSKSRTRRVSSSKTLLSAFKGKELRKITKLDLQEWAKKRSKEVAPRTFNIDRETLFLIFEHGRKVLGVLKENHVKDLSKMKGKKAQVVPPTREQFLELVAFLDKSKRLNTDNPARNSALFVRFLAYTGMRVEEARFVCWKHVDFENNRLRVVGNEEGTKNHNERTIPLFTPVRELLEDNFPKSARAANSPIFEIYTAKKLLKTASKAIGLDVDNGEWFGHHDMRHFFCSNALEENVADHVIANWLGHKDGGVLVKTTYGHLRKSFGDAEALKMNFKG